MSLRRPTGVLQEVIVERDYELPRQRRREDAGARR